MKTEDFERLKKLCDENGFEIEIQYIEGYSQNFTFVAKKKKNWGGVEFVIPNYNSSCVRKPYKVVSIKDGFVQFYCPYSGYGNLAQLQKNEVDPSTEREYVDHLKKEAFERFGEIKKGVVIQDLKGHTVDKWFDTFNYYYFKDTDSFYFQDVLIYQRGKWAKKLDQPTKVTVSDFSHFGTSVQFRLLLSKWCDKSGTEIGDYLAKCLEDYLNQDA